MTIIKNIKEKWFSLLWNIGEFFEYPVADFFKSPAVQYWRGMCKYCGTESGYGHKDGCPNQ